MSDGNRFWSSHIGQRVIIGLTVLVVTPIAVWTIAVFLNTYVAPPKVAAYRPAAIAPAPNTPEPMPTALSVRSIGSFPATLTTANAAPAPEPIRVQPARVEPAAKGARVDPVPLPPRKPRVVSAATREVVPLPRPRPRQPL
jgi:hypothetical protein